MRKLPSVGLNDLWIDIICDSIKEFKELAHCVVGGPLHIIIDDGNVDDPHLDFCLDQCMGEDWYKILDEEELKEKNEIRKQGRWIVLALKAFTPAEREIIIEAYWSKQWREND